MLVATVSSAEMQQLRTTCFPVALMTGASIPLIAKRGLVPVQKVPASKGPGPPLELPDLPPLLEVDPELLPPDEPLLPPLDDAEPLLLPEDDPPPLDEPVSAEASGPGFCVPAVAPPQSRAAAITRGAPANRTNVVLIGSPQAGT